MQPKNLFELEKAVKDKKIVSALRKDGKIDRFFISACGNLCCFFPRSGRRGFIVSMSTFDEYTKFKFKVKKTEEQKLKSEYNTIAKYKKMAEQASFTNSWIEDCRKLPTLEEFKKDPKKNEYGILYNHGITTGNKIDGKVISLSRIEKQYPQAIQRLREAIANKENVDNIISRAKFAGYEMSISVNKVDEGDFMGTLSLEYKGCLNGYYYLLINDENFIGYDVD
jgi:thiol-disulfide isomerase/thioredoxin